MNDQYFLYACIQWNYEALQRLYKQKNTWESEEEEDKRKRELDKEKVQ